MGGGELGHVALDAQREWKLAVVKEAFERFAKMSFDGQVAAAPGDDERGGLGYRTRVSAIADKQGRASMTVFGTAEKRRLTSMPPMTGMSRSSTMISGWWRPACSMADSPSPATPTT